MLRRLVIALIEHFCVFGCRHWCGQRNVHWYFGPSPQKLMKLLHALCLLVDTKSDVNLSPVGLAALLGVC